MNELVLSVFPGIGLLDMAFEQEGFCVVRGPDLLWGGDIRRFSPPPGKFAGVIGGPPCQAFSDLMPLIKFKYGPSAVADNLIPEFERCITEAQPDWFLMENVRRAPIPSVIGYVIKPVLLNNRSFGAEQNRVRRFSFGVTGNESVNLLRFLESQALENHIYKRAVIGSGGGASLGYDRGGVKRHTATMERAYEVNSRSIAERLRLQGLPTDYLDHSPFTLIGKKDVIKNGVPLPMGRAVARAVRRALESRPSAIAQDYTAWRAAHAGELAASVAWAEQAALG